MPFLENPERLKRSVEKCKNPWNGECRSADIEVYIYYKGTLHPICRDCWSDITEKDIEW
jgi:hypothetical protein